MVMISSFTFCSARDVGISMGTSCVGRNFAVRMKKVSRRKATSHIAVISTTVLLRGTLIFGIIRYLFGLLMFPGCKRLCKAVTDLIDSISSLSILLVNRLYM